MEAILPLATERGVKFGIVEHAGDKENVYPVVLSNDDELKKYIASFDGMPVYKGVQAEWTNWASCFSKEALRGLDYVITDTMTFPGTNGKRRKMWEKPSELGDLKTFMDRYVDWYVEIIAQQGMDILVNVSWLPEDFKDKYDEHWTDARVRKIVDALAKHGVAIEISSGMSIPNLRFLTIAKEAKLKFAFGSNGRYPKMGRLDYSIQKAKVLGLTAADMFTVPKEGPRVSQR
jgi:histidinol phosphatase-like PHP family hydrolase